MITVLAGVALAIAGYPWWLAFPILLALASVEAWGRADRRA